MASKVIGFRVPEDIALELERVSEERGVKVGEFLRALVDDILYPATTPKVEESNDGIADEKLKSLSNAHQDLVADVQEHSALIDRIGVKISEYEINGVLSPKMVDTMREVETLKNNIEGMKQKLNTLTMNDKNTQDNIKHLVEYMTSSELIIAQLQQEVKSLRSQLGTTASLSTKVSRLESQANQLATTTTTIQREIKRQPTNETHTLAFKDGTEHKYRVYKGKAGLVKPHRVIIDPLAGDKYVDLTEPLN